MMNKTLMAMAAVSALALATPAAAQSAGANIHVRIGNLQTDIQSGVRNGTITRAEAQPLREQLRQLRQLERQYALNGFTQAERQDLNARIRNVRTQVRYAARNDLIRYGSASWIDANQDGWDDRDLNRDGILDTTYGQGGPYMDPQCDRRTGVAGILAGILGRNETCGLQVGQRVTTNLAAVPYQYRNIYRDGNGVYYRTDGRMIYQINAYSHVVTAVYRIN